MAFDNSILLVDECECLFGDRSGDKKNDDTVGRVKGILLDKTQAVKDSNSNYMICATNRNVNDILKY